MKVVKENIDNFEHSKGAILTPTEANAIEVDEKKKKEAEKAVKERTVKDGFAGEGKNNKTKEFKINKVKESLSLDESLFNEGLHKVKVCNIDYDINDDDIDDVDINDFESESRYEDEVFGRIEEIKNSLPKEMVVEVESDDDIADAISDKTGWLVNSFDICESLTEGDGNCHWSKCMFDFKWCGDYNEEVFKKHIDNAVKEIGGEWTGYIDFESMDYAYKESLTEGATKSEKVEKKILNKVEELNKETESWLGFVKGANQDAATDRLLEKIIEDAKELERLHGEFFDLISGKTESLKEGLNMYGMSKEDADKCLNCLYQIEDTFADYNGDITLGQMIDILQGYVGEEKPKELIGDSLNNSTSGKRIYEAKNVSLFDKVYNELVKETHVNDRKGRALPLDNSKRYSMDDVGTYFGSNDEEGIKISASSPEELEFAKEVAKAYGLETIENKKKDYNTKSTWIDDPSDKDNGGYRKYDLDSKDRYQLIILTNKPVNEEIPTTKERIASRNQSIVMANMLASNQAPENIPDKPAAVDSGDRVDVDAEGDVIDD